MLKKITYGCQISLSLNANTGIYITSNQLNDTLTINKWNNGDGEFLHFDKSVFMIIPVLNHQWVGKVVEQVNNQLVELQRQEFQKRQQELRHLESNLDEEMHANFQCFQKLQDTSILFGTSTFHLVHKDSLKFVQIDYEGLKLTDFPNDACVLHFQPVYSYQKQLQGVFDTETVTICAAKAMQNRILFLNIRLEDSFEFEQQSLTSSYVNRTFWRLNLYNDMSENADFLNSGDLVAINLSETNLFLNAKQPYDLLRKIVDYQIDCIKAQEIQNLTQIIYDDLQVKFEDVIERVGVKRIQKLQSSSFWKIEKINNSGGNIQWFEPVRVKHNQSGRYLELNEGKPQLTMRIHKQSLFTLVPIDQSACLRKDSYFMIKHCESNIYFDNDFNKKKQSVDQDVQSNNRLLRIRKIGDDEDWETKMLQYSVPIIIKAINLLENITNFADTLRETDYKIEFYSIYQRVMFVLDYVQKFTMNQIITNLSSTQKYDQLSFIRQDQFRQEPLFPLICLLLYKLFPEDQVDNSVYMDSAVYQKMESEFFMYNKYRTQDKRDVEQLNEYYSRQIWLIQKKLLQTLLFVCKGNNENQTCFFEFLPISFDLMTKYPDVTQLMTQLITKNQYVTEELSKIHTIDINPKKERNLLSKLIQSLKLYQQCSRGDLINFLATCCSVGVQAVFANQEIIFKTMIEDIKIKHNSLIRFTLERERGILLTCTDKYGTLIDLTFEEFFHPNHKDLNPNFTIELNYLKAQFYLFSQLCLSRNYQPCKYFQDYFPDHALVPLLFIEKINEDMRAHLFSLCKNLYLDREPYTAQIKPNLIKNIYDGQQLDEYQYDEDDALDKVEIEEKELQYILQGFKRELINFLVTRVHSLKSQGKQLEVYNQLTLEIIRILYMILQFGLFQRSSETDNYKTDTKRRINEEQKFNESQLEKLIICLSDLLEYDEDYYKAQKIDQIQDAKKRVLKILKLQSLRLFKKRTKNVNKQQNSKYDILRDPLLRKLQNVKKILNKFQNKTCSIQSCPSEDEIEIKIEICKCFSYLLDLRQDYMIDNAVAYFQENFKKTWKLDKTPQEQNVHKHPKRFQQHYISLLKENMLLPGENITQLKNYKDYVFTNRIRHFDRVLERPFIQVLLKSFYFANDPLLQNQIVELIERFNTQRIEFKMYLNQIQLIITMESQQIYQILFVLVSKLKNNVQNSQVWLQLDTAIEKNGRNEEIMEAVIDKLYEIQTILQKKTSDGSEIQIRKMFMNIGGFLIVQKLIVKCMSLIDGNMEIFEQFEYDEQFHYKQELAETIITMFQTCVKVLCISVRYDTLTSEHVFIRLARPLLRYITLNLGQIELVNDLFNQNKDLIPLLNSSDFTILLKYIKMHGKYPEFLQLFHMIVNEQHYSSLHKDLLQAILSTEHKNLCPFHDHHHSFEKFYPQQPDMRDYKQKYLKIIEKLLNSNVGASQSAKLLALLDFNHMILFQLEKTQEMRDTSLEQAIQDQIIEIKSSVCSIVYALVKQKKKNIKIHVKTMIQIITIEAIWLYNQSNISKIARIYIIEVLLPLINITNEYFISKNQYKQEISQIQIYAEAVQRQYHKLIIELDTAGNYQINRIMKAFDLKNPDCQTNSDDSESEQQLLEDGGDTFKQDQVYRIITSQSTEYNQDCATLEIWDFFRQSFNQSQRVKDSLKIDSLNKSIWQVSEMYTSDYLDNEQKQQLILANEDLIQKMLIFLQFWKSNKAYKYSAVFVLKQLIKIIKSNSNRGKILDNLGATKIIITLIWEENESDNDYIEQLLILLKLLMKHKQVQQTTLSYLNSAISSDKFFQKFENLISSEQEHTITLLVLQIIELMCANNNIELQSLIRYQKNNKKSYDLVQQIINYLWSLNAQMFETKLNKEYIEKKKQITHFEIVLQCLITIKSIVNACKLNQILVTNSKMIEFAIKILNDTQFISTFQENQIVQLQHHCLIVLLALTEMNNKDDYIIQTLKKIIPLTVLINHLANVYCKLVLIHGEDTYTKDIFVHTNNLILESGFNAYILYTIIKEINTQVEESEEFNVTDNRHIVQELLKDNLLNELTTFGKSLMEHGLEQISQLKSQLSGQVQEKIQIIRKNEIISKSMQFFKQNTLKIEFVKDDQLYVNYFPKLACFNMLPLVDKNEFSDQADRTSTKTKISCLVQFYERALKIMLHQENLEYFFSKYKILSIFIRRVNLWIKLAFYNGLTINTIIILSYTQEAFPKDMYVDHTTLMYYRLNEPRFLSDYSNDNTFSIIITLGVLNLSFNVLILFFYLIDKAPVRLLQVWNAWKADSIISIVISVPIKLLVSIFVLFIDFDIIYYLLQIIFNIIGLVVHPFFFAYHLLNILYLEPLIPILKAVWLVKFKFIGLWFMTFLFEYWVAIISYVFFPEFFQNNRGDNLCDTMWKCVYVTFDWTFKTNGSIGSRFTQTMGQALEQEYLSHLNNYFGRFFYDNIINVVIKLCIINVLLAIIIVSYSKLRSIQKFKAHDQIYKCFICGIDRYIFDKSTNSLNTGFWNHIQKDHNAWNYLYYLCFLKLRQNSDLNGHDNFIKSKVVNNDMSWFPIRRARVLSQKQQELKCIIKKNQSAQEKISLLFTTLKKKMRIMKNT